jgi:hypothetical protein
VFLPSIGLCPMPEWVPGVSKERNSGNQYQEHSLHLNFGVCVHTLNQSSFDRHGYVGLQSINTGGNLIWRMQHKNMAPPKI